MEQMSRKRKLLLYNSSGDWRYNCCCTTAVGTGVTTAVVQRQWGLALQLLLYNSSGDWRYNCCCTTAVGTGVTTAVVQQQWGLALQLLLYNSSGDWRYNCCCTTAVGTGVTTTHTVKGEASGTRSTKTLNHTRSTCPSSISTVRTGDNSTKRTVSNWAGAEQFVCSKPQRTHLQTIFNGQQ